MAEFWINWRDESSASGGVEIDFEHVWEKPGSLMVPAGPRLSDAYLAVCGDR